ncbi:MAG TPA: DUF1549 domain-containing protein, partial [Humisphaera sp.]|nr:DUF1549 domain-containing protein [Humisphaera sp.]
MQDVQNSHFHFRFLGRRVGSIGMIAIGAMILIFSVCAQAAAPGAKLIVQPEKFDLVGAAAEHGLLATLVESDGRTTDVTAKCRFTSEAPKIVAVSTDAVCKPVGDGQADIVIEFDGLTAKAAANVSDAAKVLPASFRQDVLPVLTKSGCNAGSCHGKLAGQNGFRLSLRGYAPEWDYDSLTSELGSRRIDFAQPEKSLVLRKPTGQVPHEGGRRFVEGSRYYKSVLQWIENRSPSPDAAELDAATLDVLPGDRMMRVGDTQQLLVIARWANGTSRDVTWLSQFYSNDTSVLSVGENGLVKSLRSGATSVRVHFQGLVSVVSFTTPFDYKVDAAMFAQKNNEIDRDVFGLLASLHLPPAPLCDDATFIRRAFIDSIGTLPTAKEVRDFLTDSQNDKRSKLVDDLLKRPEYAEYWALQFADLLQNRRERDHDARGAKGVRSMHEWIRRQMAKNRPWNQMTRDLLTGTGDAVHNPQIGYFIVLMGENQKVEESDVTDSVAQAFLGTRMGCARCHNHPFERYTQDDYYHFAAFFSRTSLRRGDAAKGTVTSLMGYSRDVDQIQKQLDDVAKKIFDAEGEVVDGKRADEKKLEANLAALLQREQELSKERERAGDRPAEVTQPRTGKPMAPQPLDRSVTVIPSGQDARQELADWITDPKNANFSGSMVYRLWKHFMGIGLVEPVDDLRASNPPSNPELMKLLESEFVSHGYDLKHVMRLILNSRTYQLSSTTSPENVKDPHFFSHFYARRLESEVMADAVSDVSGVPAVYPGYPTGLRAIQLPEPAVSSYFLSLFG